MTLDDNAYAAFMLDYASGALSPAERLAAELHRKLCRQGRHNAQMVDAVGGKLLEETSLLTQSVAEPDLKAPGPKKSHATQHLFESLLEGEKLLDLPWRRDLFGLQTLPAGLPLASLLRLDPGERAPAHAHGRRDVAVVLTGAFADQFGVYELGELAFAEPGMRHQPRAVGGRSCVCFLATEPGKPVQGFIGLLASFLPRMTRN